MARNSDKEQKLTHEQIVKFLRYSQDSGKFHWNERPDTSRGNRIFNTRLANKEAGITCPRGYCYIKIRGYGLFSSSRLAWFYVNKNWPAEEIDHINGNPSDNRILNLREATRSENAANRGKHKNNKSGFKGVTKHRNKWTACVRIRNKRYRLGSFETPELAYAAYLKKAHEVHKEFVRE